MCSVSAGLLSVVLRVLRTRGGVRPVVAFSCSRPRCRSVFSAPHALKTFPLPTKEIPMVAQPRPINPRRTPRTSHARPLAALVTLAALAGSARGAILEVYNDSLITYLPSAASAVQDIRPLANQRGVNLDGSLRAGSTLGLHLNGNPLGGGGAAWSAQQRMSGVRLDIGTYDASDVDLALPAEVPWVIGRSYNARQLTSGNAARHSSGYQGEDWFQSSQPEIVYFTGATGDKDVIYLIYGADRYIELKRQGLSSNEFKTVNGAAGVMVFAAGTTGQPDTYTYYDQVGTQVVFLGFDADAGAAAGQIWKVIATDGEMAYVGDATTGSTAVSAGYDGSGRILKAYDSSDRRFSYTYSSINGATRLTQVLAQTKSGGTWASPSGLATVGTVDYEYYATGATTYGDNGYLKQVVRTVPMSSGPDQVLKTYYRYDAAGNDLLTHILDPEGVRQFDWAGDNTFDDDQFTASSASLDDYASMEFSYDGSRRITAIAMQGVCGCGGSNGLHTFDYGSAGGYSASAGYDQEECTYTIIGFPAGHYHLQYFDETGQTLSRILTTIQPLTGGSPSAWINRVDRFATSGNNPGGAVQYILPPSEANTWNNSTGSYAYALAGDDDEQEFALELTNAALYGLPKSQYWNAGGGLAASTTTNSGAQTMTLGSTALDAVKVTSTVNVDGETFTRTTTFGSSAAALRPKVVQADNPVVSSGTNGSNAATTTYSYMRPDGSAAFTKDADGTWSYTQRTAGLIVKRIQDANTAGSFVSGDDPNGDFGITEVNIGLDLTTTYTYDAQGRSLTTTAPDGNVSQVHHVCLEDGQMATVSIPLVSGGNYYGPVGYTITNQAGRVTASGQISFTGGDTSTAPSGWIDTSASDPIAVVIHGTLTRLTINTYEGSGTRVLTSDDYYNIASPAYDRTTYDYDGAGRMIGVKDPTGTITRTNFDAIGRYSSTEIGTIDNILTAGSSNMIVVSGVEYDGSASLVSGKNSLVTKRYNRVQSGTTNQRVTEYVHDGRNRVVVTINPQAPHSVVKYDTSGRVIATGLYSSSSGLTGSTNPVSTTSNRIALTETSYDELGRAYKTTRHEIDQSTGASSDTLDTEMWYDDDGRVAKTAGTTLTKTFYDRVGRVTNQFTLAADNDASYAAAVGSVSGDTVLVEDQTYMDDFGKTLMRVSIARHHDDTTTTGALDTDANLNEIVFANVEGRVSITSYWYDARNRLTDTVVLGTYGGGGGGDYDRDAYGSPHTRSATALRTTTTFDDDGTVASITDPAARITAFTYDDAGRKLKTINNYVDGTAGGGTLDDEDQITEATYTNGVQTAFTAYVPGGSNQVTTYTYGVLTSDSPGASTFASNRLLRKVTYPDSASGSDVVRFAYNAQGQAIFKQDQAGNVLETDYDTAGRKTAQRATTINTGAGFDNQVQAIRTVYDTSGRVSTVTQYNSPSSTSSGNVTDQVMFTYDDWGNPITFEQDVNSVIAANGDQWIATSAWAKATGGARTLRRTQEVLQRWQNSGGWSLVDARDVRFSYGSGGSINDTASRVETVREQVSGSPVDLATYRYLGNNRVVGMTYPEPSEDIVNNLHGTSSGTYPSLDNFGRVTSCTWFKDHNAGDLEFYDVDVAYDELGQVTRVEDNVYTGRDALYTLDDLSRSVKTEEGTWSGSAITSLTRQQDWDLDSIGNWSADKYDIDGDGLYTTSGDVNVASTFNAANEQTARNIVGGASVSLVFDAVGNLTNDKQYRYTYDVWGRVVKVRAQINLTLALYRYNGLGYRIGYQYDLDADLSVETSNSNDDPWMYSIYDSSWRSVASVFAVDDGAGLESGEYLAKADDEPRETFIWHTAGLNGRGTSSKLDDVILRDRDFNTTWGLAGDGTCEHRTYYAQNWRGDVIATLDPTGARRETIRYSTYGLPFGMASGDVDGSGVVDTTDKNAINAQIGKTYGVSGYTALLDVDLDGDVDINDWNIANGQFGMNLGHGVLSFDVTSANGGNRIGYAGYAWDNVPSKYHVRHRVYDPVRGRWSRRDPSGYVDSPTLYAYVGNEAMSAIDPVGQAKIKIEPAYSPVDGGAGGGKATIYDGRGKWHPPDFQGPLDPEDQCCTTACSDPLVTPGVFGANVWCGGKLVSCTCTGKYKLPANFEGILEPCTALHEDINRKYNDKFNNPAGQDGELFMYPPSNDKRCEDVCNEAEALQQQVQCVGQGNCNGDSDCFKTMNSWLATSQCMAAKFSAACTSCRNNEAGGVPAGYGDWWDAASGLVNDAQSGCPPFDVQTKPEYW